MDREQHQITWQDIPVTIIYAPAWSESLQAVYGYMLAHIEVKTTEALPITETGYRSIFLPQQEVVEGGGVVSFIIHALEDASHSRQWQDYLQTRQQLTLF